MCSFVCVFCGWKVGNHELYTREASALGDVLASHNLNLVFGGSDAGMMGAISRSMIERGRRVIAIIPRFLSEVDTLSPNVSEVLYVEDLHDRKRKMYEWANGFVVLPGGVGTLDEFVEVVNWVHLGALSKPIVLLNTGGYWSPLLTLFRHMADHEFLASDFGRCFRVAENPEDVVSKLGFDCDVSPSKI
jgi:uncharacterized protein (TIGR00730 family)